MAVAAAHHLKVADHALIVHLYRHGPGTDAPGLECICHIVFSFFPLYSERQDNTIFSLCQALFPFFQKWRNQRRQSCQALPFFCSSVSRSAIMAMNSELVGLPFELLTV